MSTNDDKLTVREKALIVMLREMVERMHPPSDVRFDQIESSGSARRSAIDKDLKHYRTRALNLVRGRRSIRIPR